MQMSVLLKYKSAWKRNTCALFKNYWHTLKTQALLCLCHLHSPWCGQVAFIPSHSKTESRRKNEAICSKQRHLHLWCSCHSVHASVNSQMYTNSEIIWGKRGRKGRCWFCILMKPWCGKFQMTIFHRVSANCRNCGLLSFQWLEAGHANPLWILNIFSVIRQ